MASKQGQANPIIGYRYFMSIHMGLSRGPINELTEIRVGDLVAWTGAVSDNTSFNIDKPDLFGGEEKEGGIKGTLYPLMGFATQSVSGVIKGIMGGLVPDFRGVTTLFYDGLISVNNPYPKSWKMRLWRTSAGWDNNVVWYSEKITILMEDTIHAMNPAHIIYECATNRVWGRGLPPSRLDDASFKAAADTLYTEGLGLCIRWNRQDDLDKFVQSIVNHIGAVIFIDRSTGLLTLHLLRNDYDVDLIPHFDFDTGLLEVTADQSGANDTSFNEIIVKWHNPVSDEDGQVRVQNLASIQSLQMRISTSVEYPGIPTATFAARIAQRDLDMQSGDIRRMTLKFDRRGGVIKPGGVFKLSLPSRGVSSIIMRAGSIEDSPLTDGTITIEAVQDVFGLPNTSYMTPEVSGWTPPDRSAHVVDERRIEEANYWDLATSLSPADLATVEVDTGAIKTAAKQPTALSVDYVLDTAAGSEAFVERGVNAWEPVATLTAAVDHYAVDIVFDEQSNTNLIVPSITALIDDEIVEIDVINTEVGAAHIVRGIIDTVPAPHAIGAKVWFQYAQPSGDGREYTNGETVHVKLLTRTNSQKLQSSSAPTDDILIYGRQGRPFPPGNVRVNGTRFGELVDPVEGDIVLTWTHRDRVIQNTTLLGHSAGSTGPEPGTTYTVLIYDGVGLIRTVAGITGVTYNYDATTAGLDGDPAEITMQLESVRDGHASWQGYQFVVGRNIGFGSAFDDNFNGGI